MKLRHWSHDIVTEVRGRYQVNNNNLGFFKPKGLWLSDESYGEHSWRKWCKSEGFRSWGFRYEHEVKLVPNAKILYLRTAGDIDEFAEKYKADSALNRLMPRSIIHEIDWKRVSKKYHGIIITPYQWEQRLGRHMWYYGWDCASGCIWNKKAIESVTMVKERKAPRKPTLWEERRKHKRNMAQMREALEDLKKAKKELKYGQEAI